MGAATPVEVQAMRRALIAAAGTPRVSPNPRVGCVLLSPDGHTVSVGCHRGAGTPHAEADAIAVAGAASRGATAVVTLEPCRHTGRTGPCTLALIEAGVARVVYAVADPDPQAGGGAAVLRAAGVDVVGDVLVDEATALNHRWLRSVTLGRPYVTLKHASTLDGRVAAPDGSSRWITGEAARADAHRLRGEHDALVVGTGTALADDPWLTVRDEAGHPLPAAQAPWRVVVGRRPPSADARVRDAAAPTLLLETHDPAEVLASLAAREVRAVWLEGGPRLAGAFWAAGLVDEVVAYLAPALLGAGPGALDVPTAASMADLGRLRLVDVTRLGDDVRITAARIETGA